MSQEAVLSGYGKSANDRTEASERPRYPILLRLPKGFRATGRLITVRPTHGTKPLSVVPGAPGRFYDAAMLRASAPGASLSTQKTAPSAGAMGLPSPGWN
jgi:hypothetical protein